MPNCGSPCNKPSTPRAVCLQTYVATMGLYGLEQDPLADGESEREAGTTALGEGSLGRDSSARQVTGIPRLHVVQASPPLPQTHRGGTPPTSSVT